MANQHTSALVGVERPWAEAVAAGLVDDVDTALAPHAGRAQRRTILAWLEHGAPYDYATPTSIMKWRRILVAAGPPIMYLRTRQAAA